MQELPLQELPLQELPLQELPLQELPLQELPLQELPLQELPLQELPLQELPLQELPLQELLQRRVQKGFRGLLRQQLQRPVQPLRVPGPLGFLGFPSWRLQAVGWRRSCVTCVLCFAAGSAAE
jgi:hypothetical protein